MENNKIVEGELNLSIAPFTQLIIKITSSSWEGLLQDAKRIIDAKNNLFKNSNIPIQIKSIKPITSNQQQQPNKTTTTTTDMEFDIIEYKDHTYVSEKCIYCESRLVLCKSRTEKISQYKKNGKEVWYFPKFLKCYNKQCSHLSDSENNPRGWRYGTYPKLIKPAV